MILVRLTCAVYWLGLSVLLVVPDPLALFGIHEPPGPPGGRLVHFVLFTLLAFLVWASRWPVGRRWIVGSLLVFAVATELSQAFVPRRTVEVLDLIENLLGLAAGTAIWRRVHNKLPWLSPDG